MGVFSTGTGRRCRRRSDPFCTKFAKVAQELKIDGFNAWRVLAFWFQVIGRRTWDLQSAWLLLLFCANTRATYSLRGVPPAETEQFAAAHDSATWQCFTQLLGISDDAEEAHEWASLPFQLGGCGLRSATRTRVPAHSDSLRMIHSRHPEVAETMVGTQICEFEVIPLRSGKTFQLLCLVRWQPWSLACWPFRRMGGSMALRWFLSSASRTPWWFSCFSCPAGLAPLASWPSVWLPFHHSAFLPTPAV